MVALLPWKAAETLGPGSKVCRAGRWFSGTEQDEVVKIYDVPLQFDRSELRRVWKSHYVRVGEDIGPNESLAT